MTIGKRIHDFRVERHMTLEQLAYKIGVTKAMISKYENDVNTPPYDRVLDIAEALNVSIGDLYGWHDDDFSDMDLSPDEEELLILYSGLDNEQKKQVIAFIEFLGSK